MSSISQANRSVRFSSPLGPDALPLVALSGREGMSELFQFDVEVEVDAATKVDLNELLGKPGTIEFAANQSQPARHIHGIIAAVDELLPDLRSRRYVLQLVPKFWLMDQNCRYRVFQGKSVVDIVKAVRDAYDPSFFANFQINLDGIKESYSPYNYCVQYGESDFAFLSRLFEEEGLFYHFTFANDSHTLNVTDAVRQAPNLPALEYAAATGAEKKPGVRAWRRRQQLKQASSTHLDWSFQSQSMRPLSTTVKSSAGQDGAANIRFDLAGTASLGKPDCRSFDGRASARFDAVTKEGSDGGDKASQIKSLLERQAKLANERTVAAGYRIEGTSDAHSLSAGGAFEFTAPDGSRGAYCVLRVVHNVRLADFHSGSQQLEPYANQFICLPTTIPFRAPLLTPRPRVQGTQTAIVVGPSDDKIFTDKYGRIQVRFHWHDGETPDWAKSCWLRVAQPWAGSGRGMQAVPRVGDEVLVDFLDGDPDRPIVVGSVYNAANPGPNVLPEERDQFVLRTQSNGGSRGDVHELTLDDTNGSAYTRLYSHGQMVTSSNNSAYQFTGVGGSYTLSVNSLLPPSAQPASIGKTDNVPPPPARLLPSAYMNFHCPWHVDVVGDYNLVVWTPLLAPPSIGLTGMPEPRIRSAVAEAYSFNIDGMTKIATETFAGEHVVVRLGGETNTTAGSVKTAIAGGSLTTVAGSDTKIVVGDSIQAANNETKTLAGSETTASGGGTTKVVAQTNLNVNGGITASVTALSASLNGGQYSWTVGGAIAITTVFRLTVAAAITSDFRFGPSNTVFGSLKSEVVPTEIKVVGQELKLANSKLGCLKESRLNAIKFHGLIALEEKSSVIDVMKAATRTCRAIQVNQ